ncbi:hypothetical protein MC378_11715 [Polaribacter sp. MSW13]|uniref:Uncharacterized protein n=1 Tax=Polaribacter marinus TaxID=2916838 RepID=A0A9X1VPB8_9FLAO|nr:hypothetical protein [Polaribacter marinus]MCI2229835.1 hypothetical protein [Polaribacter marinus]
MKINKYITSVLGILILFIASCDEEQLSNPTLSDSDLKVYFWGEGDNVSGIAWEGYDVLIGESLTIKLQVSPKEDTKVKWVDDATGEVLSESLEFTYAPTREESKKVNFIATRPSGYEKIIVFNFRGNIDGYTSKINDWQSVLIPQGNQTGNFTVEFDMIPSKDIMDGIVGVLDGIATTYSDNSCIVRLAPSGKIDAYNDTGYAANNDLTYHAGLTYHVKMDVDAVNMSYDIYANEQGGSVVEIGRDFKFRRKITHLDYWSMVAGNFNLTDPGTHRVLNMQITTHSQNQAPVFIAVEDVLMPEGTELEVEIEAIDPLGGNIVLEANNLPRFADFVDNGFGKGTITFKPYANCGGCDLGLFDINIVATNSLESTDLNFKVEVVDPNAAFDVNVDLGDATIWSGGSVDPTWTQLFGGHVDAGIGGDDQVVGVMPFALPTIPAGKKIKSAVLKVNVIANNSWVPVEYDVYALTARATSEVFATDFFLGDFDTDANATGVSQGFIKNGDPLGEYVMDDSSGEALATFMNNQYANGANTGEFIFLRINANRSDMPLWAHLQYDSGEVAATAPILTVTLEDI